MFGTSKSRVSNKPIYRIIIDLVRKNQRINIKDLARLLHMRIEEVEMYVYKGVNESYLTKIGEDHKAIIMAKYKY